MRMWALSWIGFFAALDVAAQTPRCDASLHSFSEISADWEITPNPPLVIGKDERLMLVRCGTCNPPVAVSIRTTDLTQPSATGPAVDPKSQSYATTFADPAKKKAFADWYNSDIQRVNPGCQVQTDLQDAKTNSSGMATATFYFGVRCRGQEQEYTSGIEYIGGRGTCAFRVTVLWRGNEGLPSASTDRVDKLFGQMKLLK